MGKGGVLSLPPPPTHPYLRQVEKLALSSKGELSLLLISGSTWERDPNTSPMKHNGAGSEGEDVEEPTLSM